jgi:peptidoglycan L-alanyl-D-glutamate endopeptidase CwlK
MPKFGRLSKSRLNTCHKDLQLICNEVIKIYDFSVLEGLRSLEQQREYYETGRSKLDGINKKSKHQDDGSGLSRAVDIMPYAKGTNAFSGSRDDIYRFYFLAGVMYSTAQKLRSDGLITHSIRWGGDWKMDMIYRTKREFTDLPHFELI